MKKNALLVGNLTIDHNISDKLKYDGPGGSVFYTAKILHNLGMSVDIISPYGKDFPSDATGGIRLYPPKPQTDRTLTFSNIYSSVGKRKQEVSSLEGSDLAGHIMSFNPIKDYDILIVAPILPNIFADCISYLTGRYSSSLKILLPQGFYRKINQNNKITEVEWAESEQSVKYFDIAVVSENDGKNIHQQAKNWSKNAKSIVTRDYLGCSIYQKNKRNDYPAYDVDGIVDSTGAGDIFSAAFGFNYLKTKDIHASADFANAAAGLSLRYHANQLQYAYKDIIKFIANTKRRNSV